MTELNFKGKEFVYNHHLSVPFRPLVPHADKGIDAVDLDGNLIIQGTAYKRDLLDFLSNSFEWNKTVPAGTLEFLQPDGATVECTLILMSERKAKLPDYLKGVDHP